MSGASTVASIRSSVDLPAPFGPEQPDHAARQAQVDVAGRPGRRRTTCAARRHGLRASGRASTTVMGSSGRRRGRGGRRRARGRRPRPPGPGAGCPSDATAWATASAGCAATTVGSDDGQRPGPAQEHAAATAGSEPGRPAASTSEARARPGSSQPKATYAGGRAGARRRRPTGAAVRATASARVATRRNPAIGVARASSPAGSRGLPVGQDHGDHRGQRGQGEQHGRAARDPTTRSGSSGRTSSRIAAPARRRAAGGWTARGRVTPTGAAGPARAAARRAWSVSSSQRRCGVGTGGVVRRRERATALGAGEQVRLDGGGQDGSPVPSPVGGELVGGCVPGGHSSASLSSSRARLIRLFTVPLGMPSRVGGLARGQAVEDGGLDDGAQLGGEAPEGDAHVAVLHARQHLLLGRHGVGAAQGDQALEDVLARPQPVQERPDRDAPQPGGHLALAPPARRCATRRGTCRRRPRRRSRSRRTGAPGVPPATARGGRRARAAHPGPASRTPATSSASVACAQSSYVSMACTSSLCPRPQRGGSP